MLLAKPCWFCADLNPNSSQSNGPGESTHKYISIQNMDILNEKQLLWGVFQKRCFSKLYSNSTLKHPCRGSKSGSFVVITPLYGFSLEDLLYDLNEEHHSLGTPYTVGRNLTQMFFKLSACQIMQQIHKRPPSKELFQEINFKKTSHFSILTLQLKIYFDLKMNFIKRIPNIIFSLEIKKQILSKSFIFQFWL